MRDGDSYRDWLPSAGTQVGMNVAGLALMVVGLLLYAALHGGGAVSLNGFETVVGAVVTLLLVAVLMVLHELTHGAVVRQFGGVPTYGAMMMGKLMPVFYCTCAGHRFTKTQFLVILLAPFVVIGLACAVLVAVVPMGGWLVLPAAIHLGGCVGDLWMAVVVARVPGDTRVEDIKTGMRFHFAG